MESIFEYYNPNPIYDEKKHRHKRWIRCDCTVRTISKALDVSWTDAYHMLCEAGESIGEMPDTRDAVEIVLLNNGFETVKMPRPRLGEQRERVRDIVEMTDDGDTVIVCNCRHHTVCLQDGKIWDTWNSANLVVFTYWIKIL